jgi:hypothetical protein
MTSGLKPGVGADFRLQAGNPAANVAPGKMEGMLLTKLADGNHGGTL